MMERRTFIQTAGAGALGLVGASLHLPSRAQDRYAKYKGQTVVMSIPAHPHYDAMLKLLPEFTKQTGIKVETDRLAMARMKDKQLLEMAKPSGDYDLVCYVVMWKGEYVKKNLVRELEPFFKNPALADPDYDFKDLVPKYVENIGLVGGPKGYLAGPGAKLYGLPYGAETSILAYRRDLFAKHGLKPPETYADLEKLLPMVKEKAGIGALTSRGQAGHQCVHAWLLHLNPLGGKVFADNWKPRFNDEIGVKALKMLKLVSDTGPVGIPGFGQGEMITSFLQGQAAMYLDSTLIFGQVNNPAVSKIAGQVSYVVHPKGTRYASQSGGLGLSIPKNAKNADAGFLLLQWLTSKAQDKAVCKIGGVPTRTSTIADREMVLQYPEFITLRQQIEYSDPDWRPIIAEWDEINIQALGVGVSEALTGKKSPEDALNGMVPKVTDIMKRAGYLKA
jgi:multiple sugar transport system substrate-binding protein